MSQHCCCWCQWRRLQGHQGSCSRPRVGCLEARATTTAHCCGCRRLTLLLQPSSESAFHCHTSRRYPPHWVRVVILALGSDHVDVRRPWRCAAIPSISVPSESPCFKLTSLPVLAREDEAAGAGTEKQHAAAHTSANLPGRWRRVGYVGSCSRGGQSRVGGASC